ncbi:hypothetical protein NC653_036228 [Populus alba x Populus x berolinensis]|uniref:Uncharacterized protein n=1 Tax=Populus alba x Populus x berolinensis TaxID=444605 RepID=A0AAD6PUM3_9ROSI|nr:hypothetical protein NC653_036228 [Populus alba x Populus x berolinensis]
MGYWTMVLKPNMFTILKYLGYDIVAKSKAFRSGGVTRPKHPNPRTIHGYQHHDTALAKVIKKVESLSRRLMVVNCGTFPLKILRS